MPTDAVILVESRKEKGNTPEYLIFIRGDKFKSSWSLAKALEEFCDKNTAGYVMSYSAGISPKEFETRFSDELSRVNVLFAKNPEELNVLKKKFNVLNAEALPGELLETDWIEPKNSQRLLPQITETANFHFTPDREYKSENDRNLGSALFNTILIICLIITAITGLIWLPFYYAYTGINRLLSRIFKNLSLNKNRRGM